MAVRAWAAAWVRTSPQLPQRPALCYGRPAALQFAAGVGELAEMGRWRKEVL